MKLSLVISTSDAGFDALAFKGDLESGIEMAKDIGYDGVEIAIRDPKVVNVAEIKKIAAERGLTIPAVGTGQAFLVEKLSLTSKDEELRKGAVKRLKEHVDFASELGAMVIIGLIRGFIGDRDREEAISDFVNGVREVAEYAKEKGVSLVIEPLNRYESDFLNTAEETLEILDEIGYENVGVLLDTFHMNIEEPRIEESIVMSKDRLFHFHVADSNRWAPGYGHLDFRGIINTLDKIDYSGFISVECMPLPGGPRESAEKAHEFLSKTIKEVEQ